MLVVTFTTLSLRCLPQQLARELIFHMNLVEYMLVLLAVMLSPHGMYRYPFSIRLRLAPPKLVQCSSGLNIVILGPIFLVVNTVPYVTVDGPEDP
jgi:hypothetical protein